MAVTSSPWSQCPKPSSKNYGVVSVGKGVGGGDRVFPTDGMVEKPKLGTAPSNFTILGRYISAA